MEYQSSLDQCNAAGYYCCTGAQQQAWHAAHAAACVPFARGAATDGAEQQ